MSKSIYDYKKKTGKNIYLNVSNFDYLYFIHRFPNIFKSLEDLGYDLPTQRIPISPAFHYAIGGIKTQLDGRVPSVKNLYAIGEVASTQVHGANRLASNSLLEGLVFAKEAVISILNDTKDKEIVEFNVIGEVMSYKSDKEKKDKLRQIMWRDVSIVRTKKGLSDALDEIRGLLKENIGRLVKFRLLTAENIVLSALKRTKSVGVHTIIEE